MSWRPIRLAPEVIEEMTDAIQIDYDAALENRRIAVPEYCNPPIEIYTT
jgi:hypothetical protein